ncbi:MAG: chemosensory pili system protein ChpA (sensor histidine kinase/response regulator) [Arenicella sp.]|jgi:chemosensory pili system protein ChpA (sensor histidine kinase/response regulator)
MSAYSTIDRETLKWVKTEVEATLQRSRDALQEFANSDDKSELSHIITHLHQIDGSLQMLELKSLSTLINESERLAEGFTDPDSSISKSSFVTLVEAAFTSLEESLKYIQQGVAENSIQIVELINQIRAVRDLDAIEISYLFSPMIDVYPPAMERQPISDDLYRQRAAVLRARFQAYLLKWLRDDDASALNSIGVIAEKLLNMSTFGAVSRLWWVVMSYVDYAKNNELHNRGVHGRIFREIDDLLRNLVRQGESALVRDPGEELIKIMLFYTGVGAVRTERMDEIVLAFQLQNYLPGLQELAATPDYAHIQTQLEFIHESEDLPLQFIRQLVSAFFEEQDANTESIKEIVEKMQKVEEAFYATDIDVISPVVREATEVFRGLRNGSIENTDDCSFHLAAAIMFVENSLGSLDRVDQDWVSNGELKLRALRALNNQEKIINESDGSNLSGSERQALLDVVGREIEENLKDIEASLEAFFADPNTPELIFGIDGKIRQIRGALQVLGEQKVGLLLQMAEDQFGALQSGARESTNALLEALAISIATMEEYVQGLQVGRSGMDYLLDRSITDLEVAIGKKVSRDDVETLLDESSDALFSWTNEQSNFSLFNGLKSNLRDLLILSKKTGLIEVEELVKEQNRLVDVISQEPAFLTGNIINTLQSNMASIAGQIIQLYGTEETAEEIELDADLAYKKSAIKSDDDGPQYHDDMDVSELGQELNQQLKNGRVETLSSTEVGKKHAAENVQNNFVDDVIFDVFVEESGEILEEARKQYAICKANMGDREAIRELRRVFHTLKDSARMVGLNNVGEIAWLSESLFNYVLDTGKSLTESFMDFADDSLWEFSKQLDDNYQNQHLIDVSPWGERTENVILQVDQGIDPHVTQDSPALDLASTSDEVLKLDSRLSSISELSIDSELLDGSQSINFLGLSEESDLLIESEPSVNPYMDDDSAISVDTDPLSDPNDPLVEEIPLSEDSYEGEFDLDSVSFSVIEDPAMRQVFIDEVKTNLSTVSEQLSIDPLMIVEDDALSIAVHTLQGNARTLGLDEVADAYVKAEVLCQLKLESGLELFPNERVFLRRLLTITHDCITHAGDIAPYFPVDSSQWAKVSEHLQGAIDADAERLEKAANAKLENNLLDDQAFEAEADPKTHNQSEVVGGADGASERFAAVLDGLDSIDDLLVEEEGETSEASSLNRDAGDLDNFEISLDSLRGEREEIETNSGLEIYDVDEQPQDEEALKEALSAEKDPAEKFKQVIQKIDLELDFPAAKLDSAPNPDTDVVNDRRSADSLIPDELTNLLENEMLAMEAAINTAEDARQVLARLEEELAAQAADITASAQKLLVDQDEASKSDEIAEQEVDPTEQFRTEDRAAGASSLFGLDDDLSDELREVFVEELKSLHSELDDEVAKLVDLAQTAKAMSNVVRYLHTIKGSSLMVQANTLGSLTHQVEGYLEGNFIRNADDLKEVRNTLEMYVDAVGVASDCFQQGKKFVPRESLLVRIGAEGGFSTPVEDIPMPQEDSSGENIKPLDAPVLEELLANLSVSVQAINDQWKSARGWSKIQAQMQTEYKGLYELISEWDDLASLSPFVSDAQGYIENLSLHKKTDFKASKALLEEVFDVAVSNARALDAGQDPVDSSVLQSRLSAQQRTRIAAQPGEGSNTAILVPGSTELNSDAKQDLARQQAGAQARSAALRIKTETLDSLTNFVGDASMNRSQMREDVLSIKGVVDDLYDNVRRFSSQLRELEIEADSKTATRSNDDIAVDRGAEFDPLEIDRYSKLQQLSRGLAENLDELGDIQSSLSGFVYKAENSLQKQERLNRELQDEIMQVRLVSFGGIGPQLRQVVRATARELNKDVELELIGAEVRLDKTILDGVIPVLDHMLRNCVDHGIENRSQRIKANKSKAGKISVECRQVAREIIINVRDDGRGLDLDKIRAKAITDNLLAPTQALKPEDILSYISKSGFSTASELTQISGRGVGMDVVQATLRRMSGSIAYDVENPASGSSFTIRLPVSLAVSSAVFVTSGGEQFAISARTIDRVVNIGSNQLISHLKADKPVLEEGGQSFTLIDLAAYFGYESRLSIVEGKLPVILVSSGVQNIAVIVEELLDTHEVVIKGLGSHLGRIPIYSGATIRADGKVVLLVDLIGISYYESYITMPEISGGVTHSIPNVMVVDDSLTFRKSAERDITALGINAVLAKDGLDAQIQLRQEIPDMILLDIEMPGMDGFELLEWVKSKKLLKDIPVVMISSRATEKHINKATQLGCSAFFGKPYLPEDLLAVFNGHLTLETPLVLKNE